MTKMRDSGSQRKWKGGTNSEKFDGLARATETQVSESEINPSIHPQRETTEQTRKQTIISLFSRLPHRDSSMDDEGRNEAKSEEEEMREGRGRSTSTEEEEVEEAEESEGE